MRLNVDGVAATDHSIQSNKAKHQSPMPTQSMWINHASISHSDGDLQSPSQDGHLVYQRMPTVSGVMASIWRPIAVGAHRTLKEMNRQGQPTWL
jgi:hypothetical protein